MSNREIAKNLIDQLPDDKMVFVINILENLGEISGVDTYSEYTPNTETMEAIAEVQNMIENGFGEHFSGSTADFFAMIEE